MYADLQFHLIGLSLLFLSKLVSSIIWERLSSCYNCFFYHQRTPLHMAAEGGHEDTVKYLVDKGAGIGIKDNKGVK